MAPKEVKRGTETETRDRASRLYVEWNLGQLMKNVITLLLAVVFEEIYTVEALSDAVKCMTNPA